MKFVSCLLFFFSIQMYHAKNFSTPSHRISPLSHRISLKLRFVNPISHKSIIDVDEIPEVSSETNVGIGAPVGQWLKLTFDTQTEGLWVFSSKYYTCDPYYNEVAKMKRLWKEADSATYNTIIPRRLVTVIEKGDDWVFGYTGKDVIKILGVRTDNVWFTQVVKASSNLVKIGYEFDGVFGLQYNPKLESGNFLKSICERMNGSAMFSVHYPRIRMINSDFSDGVLTLCGDDKTKYDASSMTYVPESDPGTWRVKITSIDVNERRLGLENVANETTAKFDTSFNRIETPESDFNRLWDVLKYYAGLGPDREFDCSQVKKFPTLQFTMNGMDYFLRGYDYVYEIERSKSKRCRLLFTRNPFVNSWTLGEPFFRKYYAKFDMLRNRIGLAENILVKS